MRRSSLFRHSVALAIASALAPATARADDGADLEALLEQHVVTTASQTAETKDTAPATTSVITAEDIRRHGIRTLNEALNYLSLGVFTTNPWHGVEIGARGVLTTADYGNHFLLLVDGHAVNEPYGGVASFDRGLGVPIELIDHIEVMLGPGAVLYGNNAMLGVINVFTKRAKDHHGVRVIADSELFTWGKIGAGFGTELKFFGRPVELTAHVEYQHQDGPHHTFAPQVYGNDSITGEPKKYSMEGPGTGVWGGRATRSHWSKTPSAYLRLVSGDLDVSVRASAFERGGAYLDSIIFYAGIFDSPVDKELERWLSIDAKYRIPVSPVFELKTRVYADGYTYGSYNRNAAAEDCFDGQTSGCDKTLRATSKWIGTEVRGTFDWLKTGHFVSMLGTDARYERVYGALRANGLDGVGEDVFAGGVDVSNIRLGTYTQHTATPWHWLSLNGGARLDVAEGYPAALSPRASVATKPWRGATTKALYSQAFRAPSTYERNFEDTYVLKPEGLRPERAYSVEGSFEQELGAHRLMFGVFRTLWTDLVRFEVLNEEELAAAHARGADIEEGAQTYRNKGRIENYGYNAGVSGVVAQKLRYGLNLTGAYSRNSGSDGESVPITVTPTFYGNARASYDLGGNLPTLALAAQFAAKRPADRAFDSGFSPMPYAPPMLELRAAVSGPVPLVRGLSYRVTANYAFQDTGPYVIGPVQSGDFGVPATLNPVDRFRAGVGLQYVWDP